MTPSPRKLVAAAAAASTAALTALTALAAAPAHAEPQELESQCSTVLWIGDSTSIAYVGGEGSAAVEPGGAGADQPLAAALFKTGVKRLVYDVYGGRSAHEEVNGHPSAVDALRALVQAEPEADCAVYSGGTNDSANVAVGSNFSVDQRLGALDEARGDADLYVTTAAIDPSASASGYRPEATAPWNEALATTWKPSLVINHAGHLAPGQFEQDGIHYTAKGTADRIDLAVRVLAGDPAAVFVRPTEASS